MKKLSIVILLLVLASFTIPKDVVYAEFTNNSKFSDLVKIKDDMAVKGITLNYIFLEFDDYNNLQAISIEVNCNDGFKGSAATKRLTNFRKMSFTRDYRDGAKVAFSIGTVTTK
jgi:hypothetical protein